MKFLYLTEHLPELQNTLEEEVRIGTTRLHLIDTAGIRNTDNQIEKIGIEKAKKSIEQCDFCYLYLGCQS